MGQAKLKREMKGTVKGAREAVPQIEIGSKILVTTLGAVMPGVLTRGNEDPPEGPFLKGVIQIRVTPKIQSLGGQHARGVGGWIVEQGQEGAIDPQVDQQETSPKWIAAGAKNIEVTHTVVHTVNGPNKPMQNPMIEVVEEVCTDEGEQEG